MACVVCGAHIPKGEFVQCAVCGLVQKSPMLTAKQIAALYHEDFDHFTPYLDQMDVHREYFRRLLQSIKGKRLLDIGCAMGALLEEAEKKGMDAYGVDISRDAVAYCRKQGLHASRIWPSQRFDVVTAFQVIEHERDPLAFVTRIHKILKKGGTAVLATPDYGGFWRKVMGKRWFGFAHPEHVILLSRVSMMFLLKKAGFQDVQISKDSGRPFPLSFALSRGADYFPWAGWILRPMGKLFDRFHIKNPINPWDDMIVFARK